MPTFNFKIKKDVANVIDKKPDKNIGTIDTNNIRLYFDVINSKKVDREKTYYSVFFKSLFLFTDFKAKSYNILQRYNQEEKRYNYYICLYEEEVDDAIKLKKDYTGAYRIYIGYIIPNCNKDFNVDAHLINDVNVEKAVIYRIY